MNKKVISVINIPTIINREFGLLSGAINVSTVTTNVGPVNMVTVEGSVLHGIGVRNFEAIELIPYPGELDDYPGAIDNHMVDLLKKLPSKPNYISEMWFVSIVKAVLLESYCSNVENFLESSTTMI